MARTPSVALPTRPSPPLGELAPEAVLRRLELDVTRRLTGLLQGEHLGLLPGPGTEPGEARLYVPGDDVRRMDWAVTARTTSPHVRDPVADRELETWAVVDLSASMDFGTARYEKRDLAIAAVAAAGFLTQRAGDRFGALVLGGGTTGVRRLPARSGRANLLALLRTLLATPRSAPGEHVPLTEGIDALARPSVHRGLAVVVSDWTGTDPRDTSWERPLRRLAHRHQVLAVEVVDPRELALPDAGVLTLVDPETGRSREVATGSRRLRERYAAAAREQRAAIALGLRRAGAAHLVLRTDSDWVHELVRFVVGQRRGSRASSMQAAAARSAP